MRNDNVRTYSELVQLNTFKERMDYLRLDGKVADETFGFDRYLNQRFYKSPKWKAVRNEVIIRDGGCDLGIPGREINGTIYIHHMNPITVDDIVSASDYLLNPEYLICVSRTTHDAIHYGSMNVEDELPQDRSPNDMCPWKG